MLVTTEMVNKTIYCNDGRKECVIYMQAAVEANLIKILGINNKNR